MSKTRNITFAAAIASIYVVLTIFLSPLSYGTIQVRIAEALTILPAFTPMAIPGLFIGCLISNIYMGNIVDIIFGSLTTLVAAAFTYNLRKRQWLAPMPPVLLNGVIVGYYLTLEHGGIMWLNVLSVTAGQFVACYIIPIYFIINFDKTKSKIQKLLYTNNFRPKG